MTNENKYTAIDYINWRGDLSFEAAPFNEVDLFLFSQLVTPDFSCIIPLYKPGVTLEQAAAGYFESHTLDVSNLGVLQSDSVLPALKLMSQTPRYKNLVLYGFSNYVDISHDEQFCGLVIELPDGRKVVTFRGTDDTLTGWKEDFNIAAQDIVPAQQDALDYLVYVAQHTESVSGLNGYIYVTGHSKGGNLAVYAACMAPKEVRDRIGFVVNWDGPGFQKAFLDCEGFLELNSRQRIFNFISQNSLVGTLLEPAGPRIIINSFVSGALAHDGFKWQTETDHFARVEELSSFSIFMEQAMKETLSTMSSVERQNFIDGLFDALSSTGAVTISDFNEQGIRNMYAVLKNMRTSPEVRAFFSSFIGNSMKLYKVEVTNKKISEHGIKFL